MGKQKEDKPAGKAAGKGTENIIEEARCTVLPQ
jgi:hypothetical protein